jgi:hypothetical protein
MVALLTVFVHEEEGQRRWDAHDVQQRTDMGFMRETQLRHARRSGPPAHRRATR